MAGGNLNDHTASMHEHMARGDLYDHMHSGDLHDHMASGDSHEHTTSRVYMTI
jgi:hypothetical protein